MDEAKHRSQDSTCFAEGRSPEEYPGDIHQEESEQRIGKTCPALRKEAVVGRDLRHYWFLTGNHPLTGNDRFSAGYQAAAGQRNHSCFDRQGPVLSFPVLEEFLDPQE